MIDVKISTITLSTQLPGCSINLTNVGKYLLIDDVIIGIKYTYAKLNVLKGKYCTTVYKKSKVKCDEKINKNLFYNQVSIIVNNNGNHINVKLFGNGSLHLTGCKAVSEGKEVTHLLYNKLCELRNVTDVILLSKDENGVWLDKDCLIYSNDIKQIIGYKIPFSDSYVIANKEYDIDRKTGLFIGKKFETQRRKALLDCDGNHVGWCTLDLIKNKKKFYKKNSNIWIDYNHGLIYYDNDLIIGRLVYTPDNISSKKDTANDVIEIEYECCPFVKNDYAIPSEPIIDVNCINVYFNIEMKINRQRFYEKLLNLNYICKYNPESYSGIKLLYKISKNSDNEEFGICSCSYQCTCTNITFLIFQSGNVIATGFKHESQVDHVTKNFIELCTFFQDTIKQKTII
jgi:TATA-box binding protein (TBP) (component of TFIID and TFIIIB)